MRNMGRVSELANCFLGITCLGYIITQRRETEAGAEAAAERIHSEANEN